MDDKVEGIILQTQRHLGASQIVKVFTPEGVLSFYKKGKKKGEVELSPFTKVELLFRRKKEGLHTVREISLIHMHLELRESLELLQAAGLMVKALLSSQMPEKPSSSLYLLFSSYLKKLSSFEKPEVLAQSFLVKILIHDGLLHLSPTCSICSEDANSLQDGESVCTFHAKNHSHSFTQDEWQRLFSLATSRTFTKLRNTAPLSSKIEKLFSFLIS